MMLTREQAAEMWCPMVRLAACTPTGSVANGQSGANRLQNDRSTVVPDSARCIADKCAMWRWGETKREMQRQVVERRVAFPDRPSELRNFDEDVPVDVPHRGYCGLAGAPTIKTEAT